MGIIVTTRGWTGAEIEWMHASGSAVFRLAGDVHNAYDVATSLRAWLDNPARPWAVPVTGVALVIESDGVRHRFRFVVSGVGFTDATASAEWISRFGDTGLATPTGALGTCASTPGTTNWRRWDNEEGVRCRAGSWRFGHSKTSHRRPTVELAMSNDEAFALGEAMRYAAQPRRAYLFDESKQLWRLVSLGLLEWDQEPDDAHRVTGRLHVLGGL